MNNAQGCNVRSDVAGLHEPIRLPLSNLKRLPSKHACLRAVLPQRDLQPLAFSTYVSQNAPHKHRFLDLNLKTKPSPQERLAAPAPRGAGTAAAWNRVRA